MQDSFAGGIVFEIVHWDHDVDQGYCECLGSGRANAVREHTDKKPRSQGRPMFWLSLASGLFFCPLLLATRHRPVSHTTFVREARRLKVRTWLDRLIHGDLLRRPARNVSRS